MGLCNGVLRLKGIALLLIHALLEENLSCLSKDEPNEELDNVAAKVCGRRMEEVVVDVGEHARRGPEIVEGAFESLGVRPALRGGDGGVRRCDLEDDRSFFVRDGRPGRELVREGIVPREGDLDLRETEFEKLQLAKVFVEEVSSYNTIVSGIEEPRGGPVLVSFLQRVVF